MKFPFSRDLAQSFRLAGKQPGFTAVVALSLALGIGATTAVFNLTYNVLFADLAIPNPKQLVALKRIEKNERGDNFTWPEIQALRATPGVGTFTTMRGASAVAVSSDDRRDYINIHFVEGSFFDFVGIHAAQGRLITPNDDAQRANVVVLSEWFASRLFPGDTSIVGRTVTIRGAPFTVIGVTPRSFRSLEFPGWFTAAIPEGSVTLLGAVGPGRDNHGQPYGAADVRLGTRRAFQVVARLDKPIEVARRSLDATFQRCCHATNGEPQSIDVLDAHRGIPDGKNDFRPQARVVMSILLAGMALVLVVVCCNIASLLLVRASSRQRELALRLSLGASRTQMAVQLMIENAPQVVFGAIGGLIFAAWCTPVLIQNLPPDWTGASDAATMFGFQTVPMLAFIAALAGICGVAFAIYPAIRATRQDLAPSLRLDARSSRSRGQGAVARVVVVAQVAFTVILVSTASLFASTLGNLSNVDVGLPVDHTLIAVIETRSTRYERGGVVPVYADIVRATKNVSGVRSAGMATDFPLFGGTNWFVDIHVEGLDFTPDHLPSAEMVGTSPGFFAASGMHLLAGREFAETDNSVSEPVVIVNAAFVKKYFSGANPVGRSFDLALHGDTMSSVRVVGMVADARYRDLREPPEPMMYSPLAQTVGAWASGVIMVRTAGDPARSAAAVSRAIEAVAPGIGVRRMQDMQAVRETGTAFERLAARLAEFVSAMALVLSAIGLYGVIAYTVARRTSEIGIRLALGARIRATLWLIAKETLALVGLGVIVGLPLSLAANTLVRSRLYGVDAHNPMAAVVAIALLVLAGIAASVIPARRAARINPRIALNAD